MKKLIRLVFEELIQQILLPALEQPRIRFTAEYSEADEKTFITVLYNGAPFDPADSMNGLSYVLIKGMARDLKYEAWTEEAYTNSFRCTITN